MKTLMTISLFAVTALSFIGCAPPANTNTNTTANTNANAAPKAALPTADTLMALEQKAWEAYKNRDGKYFEGFLGDTLISGSGEGTMSRADAVKMISEHKDDIKSFTLSEPRVTPAGADAVVLSYKGTVEGTQEGKPVPSPVAVATVFVRSGTDWKAVYHHEVPVMDAAKKDDGAKPAADTNKAASDTNKPAASDTNKAASNTSNTATAANTNSNSSANTAGSSADAALTDTLMALEKKGWEAWKAKDAKTLDELTAKDFGFIDPTGKATLTKADAMKMWTTDNPCTVSSVSLSDGKAVSITKDAAILVVKGTAVGTCGDRSIEPIWATNVLVKEGETWKSAFIMESPVRKS